MDDLIHDIHNYLSEKPSPPPEGGFPHLLSLDGRFEVQITQDQMTVLLSLFPPIHNGLDIQPGAVRQALEALKIQSEVKPGVLERGLEEVKRTRKPLLDLAVAQGRPPVAEVPGHWFLDPQYLTPSAPPVQEDGRVNFRSLSPFLLVRQGDILAYYVDPVKGVPGQDVLGREIPAGLAKPDFFEPGEGVSRQTSVNCRNVLVASRAGRLVWDGGIIRVEEVLDITSALDYHQGNINFPGHVILRDAVMPGFEIKAGASLTTVKTLDVTLVECGGETVCQGGILGHQKGILRCTGKLSTKFVEYCRIEAGGDVEVIGPVLGSVLLCSGTLHFREKGLIAGSTVVAYGSLEVPQIGTPDSGPSHLHLGVDWKILDRLKELRDRSQLLSQKYRLLTGAAGAVPGREGSQDLIDRIKAASEVLAGEIKALAGQLKNNQDATLSVPGAVYPGTVVEIGSLSTTVRTLVKGVVYFVNRRENRLEAQPIRKMISR